VDNQLYRRIIQQTGEVKKIKNRGCHRLNPLTGYGLKEVAFSPAYAYAFFFAG
jgi:hypothetical protein